MKVTELRIGNWVAINPNYVDGDLLKPFQVWCLDKEAGILLDGADMPFDFDDIIPITLPVSVLLDNGFVYNEKNFSYDKFAVTTGLITIDEDDFSFGLGHGHKDMLYAGDLKSTLKYVHTFQNFIFALTGEEAIVNL